MQAARYSAGCVRNCVAVLGGSSFSAARRYQAASQEKAGVSQRDATTSTQHVSTFQLVICWDSASGIKGASRGLSRSMIRRERAARACAFDVDDFLNALACGLAAFIVVVI